MSRFARALAGAALAVIAASPFASSRPAKGAAVEHAPYAADGPLTEARLFGEGVFSTRLDEVGITFTPDGRTAYFAVQAPATGSPVISVICVSRFENGAWTKPEVAPFSGRDSDAYPSVSPDGSKLFFVSRRPVEPNGPAKRDFDIWYVEKTSAGWGEPKRLESPVNGPAQEFSPSAAADGTLYFTSTRQGGRGSFDVYRSRLMGGKYADPENLGEAVNGEAAELDVAVAPDQSFLVLTSAGRPDETTFHSEFHRIYNQGDLYVSFRKNGAWTPARNLGPKVNTGSSESGPSLSPDGRYLFFVSDRGFVGEIPLAKRLTYRELIAGLHSTRNGRGNIWQIDLAALGITP